MNKIDLSDKIWIIENFLSEKECQDLIFFSELRGYKEAEVSLRSGSKMMKGIRNNYRVIYEDEKLAKTIWEKLKDYCPSELDNATSNGLNERFRFYRYEEGQRFKRHIDGRYTKNEFEESRITFLVYLNDDYEGGVTKFKNITVEPKIGLAVCFIHEQKHEGTPVLEGVKYVLRTDVMYKS